ncbi:MAG: hypothetical protein GVY22_05265 [Gammaproteobacteria bacterium]|jgi:hypothetical protein|nr:hypothetical protein [Gammaproteobacteria bacterium]
MDDRKKLENQTHAIDSCELYELIHNQLPAGNHFVSIIRAAPNACATLQECLEQTSDGSIRFFSIELNKPFALMVTSKNFMGEAREGKFRLLRRYSIIEFPCEFIVAAETAPGFTIDIAPRPTGKGKLPNARIFDALEEFHKRLEEICLRVLISYPKHFELPEVLFFSEQSIKGGIGTLRTLDHAPSERFIAPHAIETLLKTRPIFQEDEIGLAAQALFTAAARATHPFERLPLLVACIKALIGDGNNNSKAFSCSLNTQDDKDNFCSALAVRRQLEHPQDKRPVKFGDAFKACNDLMEIVYHAVRYNQNKN